MTSFVNMFDLQVKMDNYCLSFFLVLLFSFCGANKFDYGIFENFEAVQDLHQKEQIAIKLLEETLSELKDQKEHISKCKQNCRETHMHPNVLKLVILTKSIILVFF